MPTRLPKSIFDVKLRSIWKNSNRFMPIGLQRTSNAKPFTHYAGGPAPAKGNRCAQCKKPLTLIWEVNLQDEVIPAYVGEGLAPAKKLPLLICWRCLVASYQVIADDQIKCLPFDMYSDCLNAGESPFGDAPAVLPRRRMGIKRLPTTIDALVSLASVIGFEALDRPSKFALRTFYQTDIRTNDDLPISQLGGQLITYQGHRSLNCPNLKCPAGKMEHPYGELELPYLMKDLALIHWQDEPALAPHCFQLKYSICIVCFSLRAQYECD